MYLFIMIKISFDDFSKTRTIINQTGHITFVSVHQRFKGKWATFVVDYEWRESIS